MTILSEKNFNENANGRVVESQLAGLKAKANIWLGLLGLSIGAVVLAIYLLILRDLTLGTIFLVLAAEAAFAWLKPRLPAFIKYYFFALPDARANNIAQTTAKLGYRDGYILQAEEMSLSIFDDRNAGLMAGNVYDVFYLPRAKLAVSARVRQTVSTAQQAEAFTPLLGKLIGFTETDLAANRAGKFPLTQRLRLLKKNWFLSLAFVLVIAFPLLQVMLMWSSQPFIDDAIIFTTCNLGLIFFLVSVIYFGAIDARTAVAAVLGRNIQQVEGIAYPSARIVDLITSRREHYYLEISQALSLEIPKRVYDGLVDGLHCRIFYLTRPKCLISVEAVDVPGLRLV